MNQLIETLQDTLGPGAVLTGADVEARSDHWPLTGGCQAACIVRPASTEQVSAVLKLCHRAGRSVVTHGGLTGLVRGSVTTPDDVVLSLERMKKIAEVDRQNRTVLVEAGVALQTVQEAAEAADLLFPLDLGARGSCTIGGNISTNAGGNGVIRYGMMREQVLGIEAVLADGTVISSLKDVIKNNTGYDLKQLFIGTEGTLGIVTRAVLRLRPAPRSQNTALVALPGFDEVSQFLRTMDASLGGTLSAFEVMWNDFYSVIVGNGQRHGLPVATDHPYYVLIEATGGNEDKDSERFNDALESAFSQNLAADAAIAQSRNQRDAMWAIRDDFETLSAELMPPLTFDVSLAIQSMDDYVEEVRERLVKRWPDSKMTTFGHLGDGNIHLVISVGSQDASEVHGVEEIVYGALQKRGGIVSAEHGIGLEKKAWLGHSRSEIEIELMRTIKKALDPSNILNPGKIFQ